jgi:hypothetical protein
MLDSESQQYSYPSRCPCGHAWLYWDRGGSAELSCSNGCRFDVAYRPLDSSEDATALGREVVLRVKYSAACARCPKGKMWVNSAGEWIPYRGRNPWPEEPQLVEQL